MAGGFFGTIARPAQDYFLIITSGAIKYRCGRFNGLDPPRGRGFNDEISNENVVKSNTAA
jgi:hypothetical protein